MRGNELNRYVGEGNLSTGAMDLPCRRAGALLQVNARLRHKGPHNFPVHSRQRPILSCNPQLVHTAPRPTLHSPNTPPFAVTGNVTCSLTTQLSLSLSLWHSAQPVLAHSAQLLIAHALLCTTAARRSQPAHSRPCRRLPGR